MGNFELGQIVYRWLGGSFSVYEIKRITPKCLFLKRVGNVRFNSEFRLPKKQVNVTSEWWGVEWATEPRVMLDQITKCMMREQQSRDRFDQQIINAKSVLQDALT